MGIESLLWGASAVWAVILLLKMMRRRQAFLVNLLQEYIKAQVEWAKKRAKAARMAQATARSKAKQETELASLTAEQLGLPAERPSVSASAMVELFD